MSFLIRIGRLVRVGNTKKDVISHPVRVFPASPSSYISVWVTDIDGKNPRCLLFTDSEINRAQHRSVNNTEILTKRSLISKLLD